MSQKIKQYCILVILIFLVKFTYSQLTDHWETIIKTGEYCQYKIPTSDMGSSWIENDFNDSGWNNGISGIGFGDGDDNTVIGNGIRTVYIRYSFTIEDTSKISSLVLDADYDDGFIAFLNGKEIARDNVDNPVTWNMPLNGFREATMYSGGKPERFDITRFKDDLLLKGRNILAVEVHNETASSSDLSSNIFLHAKIKGTETIYGSTPDWFWKPVVLNSFNLPLMIINTHGQTIPEEPRILADMGLINNGMGKPNSETDTWNEYSGKIKIERRGESSRGFEKKSYSIELQKQDGSNNNVSLLGFPEENDFVLHGPYNDKTLILNKLSFKLFSLAGRWAPRSHYIEVILNGDYRGVYELTEKVKRDENRVDIDKLTSEDTSPIDISGGYILRRDKKDKLGSQEYWTSPVDQPYHERMWYEYYDPEFKDLTPDQANYIKDWMEDFDELMSGDQFKDPKLGYSKYMNVKSFIDMMFLNEISKGIDNYMFSNYFYKENDANGGQLVAGPPWDYNIGYGNVNYGDDWDASETYGWCYPQGSRTYWFERLMEDETYKNKVYCRWTKFRETIYSDENIETFIDSCVTVLGEAVDRNFAKFPILGKYVWPNLYYPKTYEEEIDKLKSWLFDRLEWMDGEWYNRGNCSDENVNTNELEIAQMPVVTMYPNPTDFSNFCIELQLIAPLKELTVTIFDLQGRLIDQKVKVQTGTGIHIFQFSNLSYLKPGIYLYKINSADGIIDMGKISKYK